MSYFRSLFYHAGSKPDRFWGQRPRHASDTSMELDTPAAGTDADRPLHLLPHRRDGLVAMLSRSQQKSRDETNHAEGFLIRLLRNPPNVAVSQERPRAGDIRDTKGQCMEREATSRQGLLPDVGLTPMFTSENPAEAYTTDNMEFANFTKDLWGDLDEENQDASPEEHRNTKEEFPPTPTNSKASDASQLAGPWWRDLLSSPAKRLRLSSWGRNLRDLTLPKFELPPISSPVAGPDSKAGPSTDKQGHKRRKDLPQEEFHAWVVEAITKECPQTGQS